MTDLAHTASTPTPLARAYDTAAATWQEAISRLGYPAAYRALLAECPPDLRGHIADVGTGSGAFALALIESTGVPERLTLIDPSRAMLDQAAGRLRRAGAVPEVLCTGIGGTAPQEGSVDTLLCAHVVEHLDDPDAALGWLLSRLRPGGRLYLAASRPHWCTALLRWKWGHRAYRPDRMTGMLYAAGAGHVGCVPFPAGPPARTSMGYIATR